MQSKLDLQKLFMNIVNIQVIKKVNHNRINEHHTNHQNQVIIVKLFHLHLKDPNFLIPNETLKNNVHQQLLTNHIMVVRTNHKQGYQLVIKNQHKEEKANHNQLLIQKRFLLLGLQLNILIIRSNLLKVMGQADRVQEMS